MKKKLTLILSVCTALILLIFLIYEINAYYLQRVNPQSWYRYIISLSIHLPYWFYSCFLIISSLFYIFKLKVRGEFFQFTYLGSLSILLIDSFRFVFLKHWSHDYLLDYLFFPSVKISPIYLLIGVFLLSTIYYIEIKKILLKRTTLYLFLVNLTIILFFRGALS
jgi:hypothetical protein